MAYFGELSLRLLGVAGWLFVFSPAKMWVQFRELHEKEHPLIAPFRAFHGNAPTQVTVLQLPPTDFHGLEPCCVFV